MDRPWRVISALESHNLRTNKEQIIEAQALANNLEFFEGCRLLLDSNRFQKKQIRMVLVCLGRPLHWLSQVLLIGKLQAIWHETWSTK